MKQFIPVFKTIFIDLKNFSDKEIESWKSDVLSIATIIQKHAFDKEFLESKINEICQKIDNLDDRNLILSIFVYYMNQSEIKEEKITKIVKELKNKKDIMSTLQLIEKRGEARGEARGISIGEMKEKVQIITKGYQKGYELTILSDLTGLSTRKIKTILKDNGLI